MKTGILPVFSNDNLRLFKNIQNSILPPEFAIFGGIFLFYKDFTENESLVDEVSYRVDDLHRKEL